MDELERQLQLRALFERQHASKVTRLLVRQVNAVAARVASGDSVDVALRSLETSSSGMRDVIEAHTRRVMNAFADHTWKTFDLPAKAFEQTSRENARIWDRIFGAENLQEVKDRAGVFGRARDQYAENYAADEVVKINDTTRERIKRVVQEGLDQQQSTVEIGKRISGHVNGINNLSAKARGLMIARTETHNASNAGADEAARATGLQYEREWLSAEDARVRAAHASAHGQRRGPDEQFNVGGYSMYRPGLGPSSQTINCRCTLRFHPKLLERRPAPALLDDDDDGPSAPPPVKPAPVLRVRPAVAPKPVAADTPLSVDPTTLGPTIRRTAPGVKELNQTRLNETFRQTEWRLEDLSQVRRGTLRGTDAAHRASVLHVDLDAALNRSRTAEASTVFMRTNLTHDAAQALKGRTFVGEDFLRTDFNPGEALAQSRERVVYQIDVPKGARMLVDGRNADNAMTAAILPRNHSLVVRGVDVVEHEGLKTTVLRADFVETAQTPFKPTFIDRALKAFDTGDEHIKTMWVDGSFVLENKKQALAAIARLPENVRRQLGDTTVVYTAKDVHAAHGGALPGGAMRWAAGVYNPAYQTVVVSAKQTAAANAHVLLHELGHALDKRLRTLFNKSSGNYFSDSDEAFLRAFHAAKRSREAANPRLAYWFESPWEMFVETFATLYTNPDVASGYDPKQRWTGFGTRVFELVENAIKRIDA